MRGILVLVVTFLTLSSLKTFAYCEHDNKDHAPAPLSDWKSWSAVPDNLALQLLRTGVSSHLDYSNLKVLVWNLEKGEEPALYSDLNKLSQVADLVLMQEAYLDKKFETLFCARPDLDWRMASSFWDYHNTMTGVATASRQTPASSKFIRSPDRETLINTPKMILASEYTIPGRTETLLVVNIHGINFTTTGPFERQVLKAVDVIKDHVGPVIFAGDFNARNEARTQFLKNILAPYGITHAHVDYKDKNEWGFLPFDHLFQRGFDVTYSVQDMSVYSSDHKPLYFELKLR